MLWHPLASKAYFREPNFDEPPAIRGHVAKPCTGLRDRDIRKDVHICPPRKGLQVMIVLGYS